MISVKSYYVVSKRPVKHYHNKLYSQIPQIKMSRKCFQVCLKTYLTGSKIRYCLKGLFSKTLAVFQESTKRGNPAMTTRTVTVRRKCDPQHYVEGKNVFETTYSIRKLLRLLLVSFLFPSIYIYTYIYICLFFVKVLCSKNRFMV